MAKYESTEITACAEPLGDAFNAGIKSAQPEVITFGRVSHHSDTRISDISDAMLREMKMTNDGPDQMAAMLVFLTAESMVAAHVLYASDRTRIFSDVENRKITSIYDFLSPKLSADTEDAGDQKTGWSQFRSEIVFRDSRKLKEWNRLTEWTSQDDFANFLEDHLEDVLDPTGVDLLSIATDLEANSASSFKGKITLQNGDVRLDYQSDTQTSVEIPKQLILGIPLFEHGEKYRLTARLRFRVSGGGVSFRLLFTNLADAIDLEFERITQVMEEKTESVILRGRAIAGY